MKRFWSEARITYGALQNMWALRRDPAIWQEFRFLWIAQVAVGLSSELKLSDIETLERVQRYMRVVRHRVQTQNDRGA